MKINLSESVRLQEMCRVSAIGHTANQAGWIEFTFSHEAMIGFATELLWLYEWNHDDKLILATHPLKVDPAPNQVLGFYLTPNSPTFVVKTNSLIVEKYKRLKHKKWNDIRIKARGLNEYFEVKEPADESDGSIYMETYELSGKNLLNISLFDEERRNITEHFSSVILEINSGGIKDLATMLLVWANNCKKGDAYVLSHLNEIEDGYNMGVILTKDSIPAMLKCNDLGAVDDYDTKF